MPLTGEGGTVYRSQLEFPTVDVSFTYLDMIGKLAFQVNYPYSNPVYIMRNGDLETISDRIFGHWINAGLPENFTDKAISTCWFPYKGQINARITGSYKQNGYYYPSQYGNNMDISAATADNILQKVISYTGGSTTTTLGTEAVDLGDWFNYAWKFSVSGSNLKSFRETFNTAKISSTDTTLTSGYFAIGTRIARTSNPTDARCYDVMGLRAWYKAPSSAIVPSIAVIEFPATGSGTLEDPIRPSMVENLVEISQSQVTHEEWLAIQCNPKGPDGLPLVNSLAVTWGAIDYKNEPTMLCAIYEGSPSYLEPNRISKQADYVRSKGLTVESGPFNIDKTRNLHKKFRKNRKEMLITENELAYQLIGDESLEVSSIADFYEREVADLKRIDPSKIIDFDATINRWIVKAKQHGKDDDVTRLENIKKK
ncbi:hypothetical protein KEJ51_09010 [Candidatus Bathyarchaeota archaeon]|nr:hypothetical protein [Candidatus Bathyarchaeota archaeon]MBS7629193.1 hypothetical protein [Candidatus Bathyarchaeota archaeon]